MADALEFINGYWTGNQYLELSQMEPNASWMIQYLTNDPTLPWKEGPLAALLGNAQQESTINPGLWESLTITPDDGFGLLQWTPSTKYMSWCSQLKITPKYMDSALKRLQWEVANEGGAADQWYPTSKFRESFREFIQLDSTDISRLTEQFMRCYERPAEEYANLEGRIQYALTWYEYIKTGVIPDVPPTPTPEGKGKFKWWIYLGRKYW